jgi:7-keto-8-aminopelargonate synthetase-like enzyme
VHTKDSSLASTAAALAALDIIESEPERVCRLWRNSRYLSEGFRSLGFDTGSSVTPVIPVRIKDDSKIFKVWRRLFDEGVFTSPVLPPAVPAGTALIRTSCMATHTVDQLDQALDAFSFVGREMNLI